MGRNDKSTWSLCRYVCSGAMSLGPIDTFRGQGCGTSAIYANDDEPKIPLLRNQPIFLSDKR